MKKSLIILLLLFVISIVCLWRQDKELVEEVAKKDGSKVLVHKEPLPEKSEKKEKKLEFADHALVNAPGLIDKNDNTEVLPWIRFALQGEDFVTAGKYSEALDFFKKAEQLQKKSTRLYMNSVACYRFLFQGERVQAKKEELYSLYIQYLNKVLSLNPAHSDARHLLDLHLGIVSELVPFLKEEAKELYNAGISVLRAGSAEAGEELFKKALELERHPDILKRLGMIELTKGKFIEARAFLLDSIELNPVQHDAYMVLGEISEQGNRFYEAKEYYIKSLASYPHYFYAMEKISLVVKKMGDKPRFMNIVNPVPPDRTTTPYNDTIQVRKLSEELKVNIFELQCWLVYHASRHATKKKHHKELPGVPFKVTVDIETDTIADMVDFYKENSDRMGVKMEQFEVLYDLKKKGLLKGAVFFYRWRDDFSEEFVKFRRKRFDDFYRMLENHL